MKRNNGRAIPHWLAPALRRSLELCTIIALVAGVWSSHLAGQNIPPPTKDNPNSASDKSAQNRSAPPSDERPLTKVDRSRMARYSAAPAGNSSRSPNQDSEAKSAAKRDGVRQASHEAENWNPSKDLGFPPGVPAVPPGPYIPNPSAMMSPSRLGVSGQGIVSPSDRLTPPTIKGSLLNLQPGETATARSLRLMKVIVELEDQIAEMAEQIADLQSQLKTREAQLQRGTDQISDTRKSLKLDQEEFQRLRKENNDLREKFRNAERENLSLMRSLSPLLKQLLHREDEAATKE